MENIIQRIESTLKSDRKSCEDFSNLEIDTADEHIFKGRVEALEWVLGVINEYDI